MVRKVEKRLKVLNENLNNLKVEVDSKFDVYLFLSWLYGKG